MADPTRVSVVVPTRNRARFLPHLLAALDAQDYPNREIVLVDDASTDETPTLLRDWAGDGRRYLRLGQPSGSYAARNSGWRAANGEIIAFTDDDCLPEPGWLSALVRAMSSPDAVGAQGVTLARPGTATPFTHQIEQRHPGPPYRTCNIAYRRRTLDQLGGFDFSLRWYADNILGLSARQMGCIEPAPEAVVLHPPRPREWRSREDWLARFAADVRHRRVLHQIGVEPVSTPAGLLPLVLWVVRPLLKQSLSHLRYALRHPDRYLHELPPMLREKRAMLQAMREYWARQEGDQASPAEILPPLPHESLASVVVVTRNRPQELLDVLETLKRQTWTRREIVVVDHGSCPPVEVTGGHLVRVDGDVSLAAARQAGVDAARGEIVAFTDDDCLPDERWLETLVEALRGRPELYGVQGRTEAGEGPVGSHAVRVSGPDLLYRTCNIAYRREAIERAGGFDLGFLGWFEDTALGARVTGRGPIGFEPRAMVLHRAMPRVPLDRARWRLLLEDERRLARSYGPFYRKARGPSFATAVIGRWMIGSPLKTLWRERRRVREDPAGYWKLLSLLVGERIELVRALFEP